MTTSALLACLALLYGIANADPAVFIVTRAHPDTAVSASGAAGLKSVSVSLSGLGDRVGPQTPPGGTSHAIAGGAGGTTVATAEPFVADMQPFAEPFNMRGGPAASQSTGLDYLIPATDPPAPSTPTPAAPTPRAPLPAAPFPSAANPSWLDQPPVPQNPAP